MPLVVRNIPRADTAVIDALAGYGVATVHEAQVVPHLDYVREAGTEGIELVMWLIMRGALDPKVSVRRRFYHVLASNTAVGRLVLENSGQANRSAG